MREYDSKAREVVNCHGTSLIKAMSEGEDVSGWVSGNRTMCGEGWKEKKIYVTKGAGEPYCVFSSLGMES